MVVEKQYLNFDLSFLDKKEEVTNTVTITSSELLKNDKSKGAKSQGFPWGSYLIFGVILLVIFNYFGKNKETPIKKQTYSNTQTNTYESNNNEVTVGRFRCSNYHHQQSEALLPTAYEKSKLENERSDLENRGSELDQLKSDLQNTKVNRFSQRSRDSYNGLVDDYNYKLQLYKSDLAEYQRKVDGYNYRIKQYNEYLTTNCRTSGY